MTRTITNTDPSAIESSAERRISDIRAVRINKAEAKMGKARERLASAQAEAELAAASMSVNDWDGARKSVLAAESECVLATSLVAHCERALTKAKARVTPEERQAAIDLVTSERKRASFMTDIGPYLEKIEQAAVALLENAQAVLDRIVEHSGDGLTARDALDALGQPNQEAMLLAQPSARGHISSAVLAACRTAGFSPWDFKELVAPHAMTAPAMPLQGAQVGKLPTAEEEDEHLREVNARHRRRVIEEAESFYVQRAGDPR